MMRASFHGGAFDGCDLALTAPYTPKVLYIVRSREPQLGVLIVGTERMVPGPLFADASQYALDREASDLSPHPQYPGMEVGEAVYRC